MKVRSHAKALGPLRPVAGVPILADACAATPGANMDDGRGKHRQPSPSTTQQATTSKTLPNMIDEIRPLWISLPKRTFSRRAVRRFDGGHGEPSPTKTFSESRLARSGIYLIIRQSPRRQPRALCSRWESAGGWVRLQGAVKGKGERGQSDP